MLGFVCAFPLKVAPASCTRSNSAFAVSYTTALRRRAMVVHVPAAALAARAHAVPSTRGQTFCVEGHRLAYASQRETATHRAMRRARKINARLGGSNTSAFPWQAPGKPKRMRWSTYGKLTQRIAAAEQEVNERIRRMIGIQVFEEPTPKGE